MAQNPRQISPPYILGPQVSPPNVMLPQPIPPAQSQVIEELALNPYDLNVGDITIIDGLPYRIRAIMPLYYDYTGIDTNPMSAGSSRTDNITDLEPANDEVYYIEAIGIDGPVSVQLYYPAGNPRLTPHGKAIFFDQTQGHKDNPFYVSTWVVPGTYPVLSLFMPSTAPPTATSDVWFYGLQFKINITDQTGLQQAIASGFRSLYVARAFQ